MILIRKNTLSLSTESSRRKVYFNLYNSEKNPHGNTKELSKLYLNLDKIIKNELSLPQKSAVILYYFNSLTMETIGSLLGVNKSTVSRNLKKAEEIIKMYLKYSM